MKTVALLEGWAGGPRLTKNFRQHLKNNGFGVTNKLADADIILAHSIGCFLIPNNTRAELILALNPPYWPGRSIVSRWVDLMKTDHSLSGNGTSSLVIKKLWEGYYILAKPRFTWSVLTNQSELSFLKKHENTMLVLVRNKNDVFCSARVKKRIKDYKNVSYVERPGNHDDYYTNPQPYIDLILKEI